MQELDPLPELEGSLFPLLQSLRQEFQQEAARRQTEMPVIAASYQDSRKLSTHLEFVHVNHRRLVVSYSENDRHFTPVLPSEVPLSKFRCTNSRQLTLFLHQTYFPMPRRFPHAQRSEPICDSGDPSTRIPSVGIA